MPSSDTKQISAVSGYVVTKENKKDSKTTTYDSQNVMGVLQKKSKDKYTLVRGGSTMTEVEDEHGNSSIGSIRMNETSEKNNMSLDDVMKAMEKLMKVHSKKSKSRSRSRGRGKGKKTKSK